MLFQQHPKPWMFSDHNGVVAVYDANGGAIIATGDMENCTGADIELARLIVAAPDLLNACESAQPQICSYLCPSVWKAGDERPHDNLCKEMRAAIARARGQS